MPAILSYPAGLPQGVVRDQAVTIMDWYPTILDLCGVTRPAGVRFDGRSVLPLIEDAAAPSRHERLYWQWQQGWAVREGDWKLIHKGRYGLGRPKLDEVMLVNLADEKPEARNHAQSKPEVKRRLEQAYQAWARDVFSTYAP